MPQKPQRLKAARVLEALHAGQTITLDGMKLVMVDGQICIEAQAYRYRGNQREELPPRLLGYDLPINHFIEACENLSDDDIFIIGAQTVLTRDARRRTQDR